MREFGYVTVCRCVCGIRGVCVWHMHRGAAVASAVTHRVFTYLTQFVHFITLDVQTATYVGVCVGVCGWVYLAPRMRSLATPPED